VPTWSKSNKHSQHVKFAALVQKFGSYAFAAIENGLGDLIVWLGIPV